MKPGIYFVDFGSSLGSFGSGLVVFDGKTMHGGDASYLYRRKCQISPGSFAASIEVSHYQGQRNNILGDVDSYTVQLSGTVTDGGFSGTGTVPSISGASIHVSGRLVKELLL